MTTSTLGRRAVACHIASYTAVQLAAAIGITRAFDDHTTRITGGTVVTKTILATSNEA
ncbi:hypothetical protein ACFYZ5_10370 [Streptomyces chartreusis]|uniref:hypothetical protein n=1 Tax=Streptomyces chartreusis TaxID=1969 RepID=UPI0036C0B913